MQCADLITYLSDYIDNDLAVELTREAEEHLATCHNCKVVLDTTRRTVTLLKEHGRVAIKPVRRRAMLAQLETAFLKQSNHPG